MLINTAVEEARRQELSAQRRRKSNKNDKSANHSDRVYGIQPYEKLTPIGATLTQKNASYVILGANTHRVYGIRNLKKDALADVQQYYLTLNFLRQRFSIAKEFFDDQSKVLTFPEVYSNDEKKKQLQTVHQLEFNIDLQYKDADFESDVAGKNMQASGYYAKIEGLEDKDVFFVNEPLQVLPNFIQDVHYDHYRIFDEKETIEFQYAKGKHDAYVHPIGQLFHYDIDRFNY